MASVSQRSLEAESSPLYQLVLALLVSMGLIVLIFGCYEIIERVWLSHLDAETLRVLHRVRGVFTALVVGLTVGFVIIRSSPALLSVTSWEGEGGAADRVGEKRLRLYAHWFIAMRWIAVLVAAILVFLGVGVFRMLPEATWWPLMGTVALLGVANLCYTLALRRGFGARPLLILQSYLDLVLMTVLLHFSGGIANPLGVFMLFQVIIGGILLSRTECFRMAGAGSLLFALLALAGWGGFVRHYPLQILPAASDADAMVQAAQHPPFVVSAVAVQAAILFLTAYFVTTLSERLRRNQRVLSALAERALADRVLLEQSLETTQTGIRLLSTELVPEWANARWKEWFGEIGDRCQIFPDDPHSGCPAKETMDDGEMEISEISPPPGRHSVRHAPAADGSGKVYQITSAPLHDARGGVIRVVQLVQDITEQKETHARMMRAGQMAAVGELAGQVAHEVNNPIAIISAKANLLLKNRREEMSDKIAEELTKVVDLSTRVARIAQGLLSYSRPSPTTREAIDLRPAIRKSISMIEHRARNREITIQDHLPEEEVRVTANPAEMEQVFLNLFINAIQAMHDGGRLTVSLAASRVPVPTRRRAVERQAVSMVTIAVDDTGGGIPPELRERVFEPFFTTKQEGHGTGLGLSICQGLLRSHGGDIVVEDAPGGGARFLVRLPADSAPKIANAEISS